MLSKKRFPSGARIGRWESLIVTTNGGHLGSGTRRANRERAGVDCSRPLINHPDLTFAAAAAAAAVAAATAVVLLFASSLLSSLFP